MVHIGLHKFEPKPLVDPGVDHLLTQFFAPQNFRKNCPNWLQHIFYSVFEEGYIQTSKRKNKQKHYNFTFGNRIAHLDFTRKFFHFLPAPFLIFLVPSFLPTWQHNNQKHNNNNKQKTHPKQQQLQQQQQLLQQQQQQQINDNKSKQQQQQQQQQHINNNNTTITTTKT